MSMSMPGVHVGVIVCIRVRVLVHDRVHTSVHDIVHVRVTLASTRPCRPIAEDTQNRVK